MSEQAAPANQVLSLPQGGAIRGIGETFQHNLFSGTGNFTIPIATSPGRAGFGPQQSLQYSTGNGNGPFGLGWQLAVPNITCKTEKGLPTYDADAEYRSYLLPSNNSKNSQVCLVKRLFIEIRSIQCEEAP